MPINEINIIMSYSVDLWNLYETVEKRLESHIKGLNNFIYIINEYFASQNILANNLKRLYEFNDVITTYPSLLEGISGFKGDLSNQYDYLTEFLSSMKDEIITPLKILKEKLTKFSSNNEMRSIEKNYNSKILQLDSAKNKFHNSAKDAEETKLRCEMLKKNPKISHENIKKDEMKVLNALKLAKDNENLYLNQLNDLNDFQIEYIEIKKRNLNQIQKFEEEIGQTIKDSLRKYIVFQVSYIRNFQYDIDKKASLMENIDIKSDIFDYIYNNRTNDTPPNKFEYFPYISDFSQKKYKDISKEIINEVKSFIENVFTTDKEKEITILKNKNQEEIEVIAEKCFKKEKISEADNEKILKLINNKSNRRILLNNINGIRKKIRFIDNIAYENIGEVLSNCLDLIITEKDYESADIIINISTSLYKLSDEVNKSNRVFLQNYLSKHKIWNNFEFWKELIFFNIIEEMHKQKNFKLYFIEEEKEEEKQNRIYQIAKIQLNTFVYHMLAFDTKKIIITDIIQDFKEYYNLEDSISDSLIKIVDDYKNKNDEIFSSIETKSKNIEEETKINSIDITNSSDIKKSGGKKD